MIVLGIADNHDSGAALLMDGRLVAAVNQERVDRQKCSGAFPWGAVDAVLAEADVKASAVDRVVVGTAFTPSAALRALPAWHQGRRAEGQFSPALHAYIVYQSMLRKTGLYTAEVDACAAILRRRMGERMLDGAELQLMDHHRAHAEGAYRTFRQDHCLVLTIDAMGDGTTATASLGRDGQLDLLWRQSGLAGIGTFYSRITEMLGFVPVRHEGKVTGLAAAAVPPPPLVRHFRDRVRFVAPGFLRMSSRLRERPDDGFWSEVRRYSREEVAAAAQAVLEEAVLEFVRYWLRRTGTRNLAVAGGTFANVRLNGRLLELEELDELWVMPHMGDGGLPVGAALGSVDSAPRALASAALGPSFSQRDMYKAIKRAGVEPRELAGTLAPNGRPGDIEQVATLISNGGVVGRFDGRMEWGPRALGRRSLLAKADDPSINDWLNKRLRRSEFMPFAPLMRAEDAHRWVSGLAKVPDAVRFMTVCLPATDQLKRRCPAAVHLDGTGRPQVLHEAEDPALYRLLTRVGELTGTPVLINTSFNLHEEPIVCTPTDGVRAWEQARLEGLWMGPYVVGRSRFPN